MQQNDPRKRQQQSPGAFGQNVQRGPGMLARDAAQRPAAPAGFKPPSYNPTAPVTPAAARQPQRPAPRPAAAPDPATTITPDRVRPGAGTAERLGVAVGGTTRRVAGATADAVTGAGAGVVNNVAVKPLNAVNDAAVGFLSGLTGEQRTPDRIAQRAATNYTGMNTGLNAAAARENRAAGVTPTIARPQAKPAAPAGSPAAGRVATAPNVTFLEGKPGEQGPPLRPVAAAPSAPAGTTGATPPAGATGATGDGSRVVGNFNGRDITEAEANRLAGQLNIAGSPAPASSGTRETAAPAITGEPGRQISPRASYGPAPMALARDVNLGNRGAALDAQNWARMGLPPDEIVRRMQNVATQKLTPTARRALMGIYANALDQAGATGAQYQQQFGETGRAGMTGEIGQQNIAAQGDIDMDKQRLVGSQRLDELAVGGLLDSVARRDNAALELTRSGENITLGDGRIARIGADGKATIITDADGKPIVGSGAEQLSPKDILDSLNTEEEVLRGTLLNQKEIPEDVQARLQRIAAARDALLARWNAAQSSRQGDGQKPTLEQFMAQARAANPGASDAELEAYYNENYGSR